MKKLLAVFFILTLAFYLPACTNSTKEDSAESSESGGDGLEIADESTKTDTSGNLDETQAGFLDEQLPEDSLGATTEEKPADVATTQEPKPTDSSDLDLSLDAPATPAPEAVAETPAPTPEPTPSIEEPTPAPVVEAPKEETPKPVASLQKVKEVPYREGGQLLNSVYLARPGDNYKKISTLIYGSEEKEKDLKKANPGMKTVKPGNKVYYNSPKRSEDDTRILNFYEDSGATPEVYIAKDGENLKTIAKELLGYKDAWKEIWATNSVESKDALAAGTELRFWKGAVAATTEVASNPPPPAQSELPAPTQPADMPPPPPAMADMPPPPPDMAPPPPPTADMPPPPPAMADMPPPPPPMEATPPPMAKKPMPVMEEALDQDTIMALGGAGIVAAALAALIVIRKRKQRASEYGNQVNVG